MNGWVFLLLALNAALCGAGGVWYGVKVASVLLLP